MCQQRQGTMAAAPPRQRQGGSTACGSSSGGSGDRYVPEEDQSIKVKCMLAESSGKLDLAECELAAVPPRALDLPGAGCAGGLVLAGLRGVQGCRSGQLDGWSTCIVRSSASWGLLWFAERCVLDGSLTLPSPTLRCCSPIPTRASELEELSLAGNQLQELPPEIGQLRGLVRLQLSGNQLCSLPDSIGQLPSLAGLWLHGNLLQRLPAELGSLSSLTQLSLSGNCLEELPSSLSSLAALQELSAAGNRLADLPAGIGELTALTKLHLHGNQLR